MIKALKNLRFEIVLLVSLTLLTATVAGSLVNAVLTLQVVA
jgi:hypothetical protein